jgi:hypothetical protein
MSDDRSRPRIEMALLPTVLFLGCLWGATEALAGGLLHRILPGLLPGRIMMVVAMALLAYAVRTTRRPWLPAAMALVAAPLKLLSAIVYAVPVTAPEVLNPALAILAQGACFAVLIAIVGRRREIEGWQLALVGAGAGALQVAVWAGLVVWPATALYPPLQVLQELNAKLPPAWAGSLADTVGYVVPAAIVAAITGAIGAGGVGFARPRPVALRPATALAGSMLCIAIYFSASWLL